MKLLRGNAVAALSLLWFLCATTLAQAEEIQSIKFDDIKLGLEAKEKFDAKKHLTEKVEKLQEKKVRIKGWIHPSSVYDSKGITKFILIRDNLVDHLVNVPLHDLIVVQMDEGSSIDFTTRSMEIEGVFHIEEIPGGRKGRPLAIYQMKATKPVRD